MSEKFYITTPIYYPSGNPHIGHCYTTVACDAIARYKRMQGYDVMFLTGTDEHGIKIQQKAEEAGKTPQQYVDEISEKFKSLWKFMNVDYDRFIRTTDDYHVESVQKIFKELYDRGYIYKSSYEGKYCTPCESFWTETQLVDGKCPDCGREVTDEKEESYFFKISEFSDRLEDLILNTDYLRPKTRAQELVNNFIRCEGGLQDLCVSRTSFNWGVPVTFDSKHVVYVWIDALSNYITALGYQNGQYDDYDKFWPADIHMVAKDIMRFHAIIWPAILMALDLPLPKHLAVHGWITFNGQKMSKSKGNVVDPFVLGERYGADAIRYHILREMPLGADSSFSNEIMINRINSDLANGFGNLVSRTVAMVIKYFDGTLIEDRVKDDIDDEFISEMVSVREKVDKLIDETQLSLALAEIFKFVARANKYIDETTPWVLAKDEENKTRLATVMYNLLEAIRVISTLLSPFMPEIMPKAQEQIGAEKAIINYENAAKYGVLPANVTVKKGDILFKRIDIEKEIEELNAMIHNSDEDNNEIELEPYNEENVDFDTFCKSDLRAVKIKACEAVKKSDKLLKFTLDDGSGTDRTILSGIRKYYEPEQLIGKTAVAILNLPPRKMMGIESCGMLISAVHTEKGEEKLKLILIDDEIPAGAKLC